VNQEKLFNFKNSTKGITDIDADLNPYLMYLLGSIAELVGYAFCHLNDVVGRKKVLILFLTTTGVVCLGVAFIPTSSSSDAALSLSVSSIMKIACAFIGKAAASASLNSAYVFISLLYPTDVRTTAILFISNIGSIGAFISPQINLLRSMVWQPLPYVIFSSSAFTASLFVLLLPDPKKVNFI
jgi:MFS family permease